MSMIDKIGAHGLAGALGAAHKKKPEAAQDAFSAILRQMETGGGAPRGENSGDRSDEKTTTVTKVMADGSVHVTVYRGTEIISENKTKATTSEKDPTVIGTRTERLGGAKEADPDGGAGVARAATLLG